MNIIGTKESLFEINKEEMLNYFNKYYVANNSVISIAGNFDFEEMVKKIEEKFKHWNKKDLDIKLTPAEFNSCYIAKNKDTEQVNLSICLKSIPMGNVEKLYALSIINNVFGGSVSSRLFQKIREERGLVYSIYSSQSAYRECGEFGIFASMSNENLEEVYELIIEEIKEIRKNYLTEKEVKNSKEQLKGSFILGLESTSSRMLSVGKAMLLSKKVRTTDEILNLINNVDMKTIKEVIDEVFNLDNIGVCIVGRDVENIKMGV
jgi:predicted Zn-dependent peptidase